MIMRSRAGSNFCADDRPPQPLAGYAEQAVQNRLRKGRFFYGESRSIKMLDKRGTNQ